MSSLRDRRVIVTGGTTGLGLGIVEAMVRQGAAVTVVARSADTLAQLSQRLGVSVLAGDIADRDFAERAIVTVRPDVVILNAGATPVMGPIHQLSWEDFSRVWDSDVKAALYWVQAAIRLPLASGARVLLGSSGAAIAGSPLSGGYAGAKRMLWFMTKYANGVAAQRQLGIRFQAIVPQQIVADTGIGDTAAAAYAGAMGVSREAFLARFGAPLPPRLFGEQVLSVLVDPKFADGVVFGLKGDVGVTILEGGAA
jgi:NAD(P)-dependent dehydrogenase (short-subunit alcohol dehydrogenase family)